MKTFFTKNKMLLALAGLVLIALPIILWRVQTNQNIRSGATAGTVAFSFVEPVKNVLANTDFEVDVMIDPNGAAVKTLDFTVRYPKNMLTLVNFTVNGNAGITEAGSTQSADQGEFNFFNFSGYTSPNITTPTSIGKMKFHVAGTLANGTLMSIGFSQAIAANSINGVITTHPVDISSAGTYTVGTAQTNRVVNFFFEPALSNVLPGQSVILTLKANTNTLPLQTFDIAVTYPSDKLQIVNASTDVTKGTQIDILQKSLTPGVLNLVGTGAVSINGVSETIAAIKFTALSTAPLGTSQIGITVTSIDPVNPKSSTAGKINIQSAGGNLTPTPTAPPCSGVFNSIDCPPPPTPTPTIPARTPTPAPTLSASDKGLRFFLKLPGIGSSTNPALNLNNNPGNPSRVVDVSIKDDLGVERSFAATVNYVGANSRYEGTVNLGTTADGSYTVKVRMNNTLFKSVPGPSVIVRLAGPGIKDLPETELVAGDISRDNKISLEDYNAFIACYDPSTCTKKTQADFNDDGKVDDLDLGILISAFQKRSGD